MNFKEIELPSNRKFGFFFAAVFAVAAIYFYDGEVSTLEQVLGLFCIVTLILSFAIPSVLTPFNKLWMGFGYLLGKTVSPIVLGFIFLILITPIAIVMRLVGRDELRLKMVTRETHWKKRDPIGPEPSSFKNQF